MTNKRLSMTEVARIAQQQRTLALKQQDSALLTGFSWGNDDDSHLDLTTRIRFLEACGGPPPYVLERIDESGNLDRYLFERPFLLVGRSPACEVACREASVSFRHVYLQFFKGVMWWFDLDSRSGVMNETGQQRRAGCLRPGMTLSVGEYSLRLVEASKNLPSGPAQSKTAFSGSNTLIVGQQPDLPQVSLEFENGKIGSEEKQVWPIENSITLLGRRSCCDIRFSDESVSRVHASLVLTTEGLWIVDLLGRGGTKVNGVPSAYAYLQEGSLIQMGGYKIRVRYGNSPAQPHPAEAVLKEEERPRNRAGTAESAGSSGGTVSEELLYQLVTQMAEMQKQMFDQSQMQIGLLVQMLGSIHQSQQDMLRTELSRVHEISQEIHELKLRLTVQETSPAGSASDPSRLAVPPSSVPPPNPGDAPQRDPETAGDAEDLLPAPSLFEQDEPARQTPQAPETEAPPRAKSNEIQDHAILFQRMQNLDRERNSRLQKIFRAFTGSG